MYFYHQYSIPVFLPQLTVIVTICSAAFGEETTSSDWKNYADEVRPTFPQNLTSQEPCMPFVFSRGEYRPRYLCSTVRHHRSVFCPLCPISPRGVSSCLSFTMNGELPLFLSFRWRISSASQSARWERHALMPTTMKMMRMNSGRKRKSHSANLR